MSPVYDKDLVKALSGTGIMLQRYQGVGMYESIHLSIHICMDGWIDG